MVLPEAVAKHACQVLRLRVGSEMVLFDGTGGEYAARIATIDRDRVCVEVLEWHGVERETPIRVTLAQALQAGEKMDMTVQKAVELGAARVAPLMSERSLMRLDGQRAERRAEHWRAVAIAACEQCGRNTVPEVDTVVSLDKWLEKSAGKEVLRLMLIPGSEHTLESIAPPVPGGRVELLVGAEGGFTPEEIRLAELAGYFPIRLGPRILRTETAGLAAMAAIQCLWGDFREGIHHV